MCKFSLSLLAVIIFLVACNNTSNNTKPDTALGAKFEFTTNPDITFDTLIQGHTGFEKLIGFKNIGHKRLIIRGIKSPSESFCIPEWDKRFYLPGEMGTITFKCFVYGTHLLNEIFIIKSNSTTQISDTANINGVVVGPPRIEIEIVD